MVAQKDPLPIEESSAFHQLRTVEGDDSPIVRVLAQMDNRFGRIEGDIAEMKGGIAEMNTRIDGIDKKLDRLLGES